LFASAWADMQARNKKFWHEITKPEFRHDSL
jgi:hypothetical protein